MYCWVFAKILLLLLWLNRSFQRNYNFHTLFEDGIETDFGVPYRPLQFIFQNLIIVIHVAVDDIAIVDQSHEL